MTSPRLLDSLLHFFFPERCLLCRQVLPSAKDLPFCASCQSDYRPAGRICPQCEGFFRGEAPCSCPPEAAPLRGLFILALYDRKWRRLIHDLKYKKRRVAARHLGALMAKTVAAAGCLPDLVVPIPLHKSRELERGYNQSALLAHHAARALQAPCRHLLVKNRATRPQTAISRSARRENIRGVFDCRKAPPAGCTVLLVDDVYSTGSTMKEAASNLQKNGALVFGAVVAYNPPTKALQRTGFYAGLDQW